MNSAAHLGNTALNVAKLREVARKELPEILDKDHGVEKIYHLDSDTLDTDCSGLIYICRPKLKYMRYIATSGQRVDVWLFFVPQRTMICERVLEEEGVKGDITIGDYALDWIPYEDDLISMELDPSVWKEIYLDGDLTSIYYSAKALMRLQSIYGLFPKIIGKGDAAKQLADMLLRMRREQTVVDEVSAFTSARSPSLLNTISNHIDQFIIIDRNVDVLTPLCTELTYEGLIDEIIGIKHCLVELDASLVNPSQPQTTGGKPNVSTATPTPITPGTAGQPGKKKKYVLNSSDKLFNQLRDQNFAVVGGMLNKIAKRINENYEERHHAKTVAQIRDFVGRLDTGIAEQIMEHTITEEFNRILEVQQNVVAGIDGAKEPEYIEEMINKQKPLIQVLRLLCLMSLAQGGLKAKLYDQFQRDIVQTYGYEHITTLQRLEKLGLLTRRTSSTPSRSAFAQSRRLLRLIVDDVDEFNPNDISYVYSGYAPLSVRLIQCALKKIGNTSVNSGVSTASLLSYMGGGSSANFNSDKGPNPKSQGNGWRGYEDILKQLPGKSFEIQQTVEYGPETNAALARARRHGLQHGKTTIIFFLGGCTHTEVSAIRLLAQHDEGRDYLIATTQMINGNTFLEPVLQGTATQGCRHLRDIRLFRK
ncbi:Sec1-like protein [Radiomyces spectabilis]|uniref:Sec1-like protein n=1 Tax=Radiomyces spectabilis TaxID=64574 RepID=UPI00221EFACD|nr:Sec1-like protein [Radiomyces spectabilis]KAI8394045.1 Sec1-like protein [Radiomyces spectabilis]